MPEAAWCQPMKEKLRHCAFFTPRLQKANGTCNTNFKKTQELEQVTKVLEDFVEGNRGILVSGTLMPRILQPSLLLRQWSAPGRGFPTLACLAYHLRSTGGLARAGWTGRALLMCLVMGSPSRLMTWLLVFHAPAGEPGHLLRVQAGSPENQQKCKMSRCLRVAAIISAPIDRPEQVL